VPARLFALDHNFPHPIVRALDDFTPEAELVAVDAIDPRLPDLDDWELLLALHHHPREWDGLITADSGMLALPRERAVLMQTQLSLVVVEEAGHDMLKATGLLFAHLADVCKRTRADQAQLWRLRAAERRPSDPWKQLQVIAERSGTHASQLYDEHKLAADALSRNPLR
jgi:hypothetical protein